MTSSIGITESRTTMLSTSTQLLASLRNTQRALLEIQQQISTGRALNKPSDDAVRTSTVLMLESQIDARNQHERNLQHALGLLNTTDAALADATELLLVSKSIASSQVGIGSSAETRASQASVIDVQIRTLMDIANLQFQGVSLFAGNRSAQANAPVFEDFLGGIRYLGSQVDLLGDAGSGGPLSINSNGQDAFAAMSSRVIGKVNLDPQATDDTPITHVNGVQGIPVRLGAVSVIVDSTSVIVDLKGSQTLGDVVTRVNDAINSIDPAAGDLQVAGTGYQLNSTAGHTISIRDLGSGQTTADLGISISSTGGVSTVGGNVDPKLATQTTLAALGVPIDIYSGLEITQGAVTKVADFSSAVTVEDMINVVDQLGLGLQLEINDQQTGFNLISTVSGLEMSIGENRGTTATDLGLRSFSTQTLLTDFRFGLGVETVLGEDDFAIELHDGRSFNVNLDGVASAGDVLTAISLAASTAGLAVGAPGEWTTEFNVGLVPNGNGFYFEDLTAGAGDFRAVQLGTSLVATHLGIYTSVGSAGQIFGQDTAKVRAESVFTHLINLRDSLLNDDSLGITLASERLDMDLETLIRVRADVGSRGQWVEQQQERSQQLKIAESQFLSELQDADLAEAITRFTQLQQQLEASLAVGSANLQLSLVDFLR